MTPPAVVKCAWCREQWRPMGDERWRPMTAPIDDATCSHGLCDRCLVAQTQEIKKRYEVTP